MSYYKANTICCKGLLGTRRWNPRTNWLRFRVTITKPNCGGYGLVPWNVNVNECCFDRFLYGSMEQVISLKSLLLSRHVKIAQRKAFLFGGQLKEINRKWVYSVSQSRVNHYIAYLDIERVSFNDIYKRMRAVKVHTQSRRMSKRTGTWRAVWPCESHDQCQRRSEGGTVPTPRRLLRSTLHAQRYGRNNKTKARRREPIRQTETWSSISDCYLLLLWSRKSSNAADRQRLQNWHDFEARPHPEARVKEHVFRAK